MKLKIYNVVNNHFDLESDGIAQYDIAYSNYSERNKLDLYLPTIKKEKYPLVIFIHGGAFFKSNKSRHLSNILNCLLYGYAVASIDYRLNDEVTYPFIRQDCIDAFNYLASLPEIDSHKIIFWGESHGAFIADDITITCHKDLKYPPAGVVSFYAPIDLYDYFLYKEEHNEHVVVNGRENDGVTFGAEGDNLLKVLKQYSVLDKINGNEPPFFLMHGLKDECIPFKYTEEFDAALSEKGVPHILNFVQDGLHGIDFYADPIYNAPVIDFINRIFEGEEI